MFLRREDFVTPRPRRVYSTCYCKGVQEYQVSHSSILETKVGNESLWNPEFVVLNQGYNGN